MTKHEHAKESSLPFGLGPDIHTVTIRDGGKTYEGVASSRSEAERRAEINKNCGYSTGSSGSSSGSSSGGSCCYVTTACLDALGLPRDGLEMRAMKTLTKNHVLTTFSGKRDYVAYQRKGPVIASAIQSRKDSQGIWENIYESLKEVTAKVLSGDYKGGHESYKGLMLSLESQFVRA